MELDSLLSEKDYNRVIKLLKLKDIIFYVTSFLLFALFFVPQEYLLISKDGDILDLVNNYILTLGAAGIITLIGIEAVNVFKCKREKDLSKKITHIKKSYWNRILIFLPLLILTISNYSITGDKKMIFYFWIQIVLCNVFLINRKAFTKLLNSNENTLTNP